MSAGCEKCQAYVRELTSEEAEAIKERFLEAVKNGRPPSALASTEGWVRRSVPGAGHVCDAPMREVFYKLPAPPPPPGGWPAGKGPAEPFGARHNEVDGRVGDLWRCECGRLWRVACDYGPRGGYRPAALEWRPATWWQRLRYRGRP